MESESAKQRLIQNSTPSVLEVADEEEEDLENSISPMNRVSPPVVENTFSLKASSDNKEVGSLTSTPATVRAYDDDDDMKENSILAMNSVSLPVIERKLNTEASNFTTKLQFQKSLAPTPSMVKVSEKEEDIQSLLTAMDTFFLPGGGLKSNFEVSSDTKLTWFQQVFASCKGGEESNKVGLIS